MNNKAPQKQSSTDSFFGMALTQAFMGFAFGVDVDMAWEACEVSSAMRDDRKAPAVQPAASFDMGKKKSLGGLFEARANDDVVDLGKPSFGFGYDRKAPSPSSNGFSFAA
jgi:hypothetical protein